MPELGAGNFSGGCIFHQVIDRNTAVSQEPLSHVLNADIDIGLQPLFGNGDGG